MRSPQTSPDQLATDVDGDLVVRLQGHRSYPSVSVLLTTTPSRLLASGDVVRLHLLIEQAERRLSAESPDHNADTVVSRLRALATAARRAPADRGLALFASGFRAEVVRLPVMVDDRVVIASTFATRDLVRSVHAHPYDRLLVPSERGPCPPQGSSPLDEVPAGDPPASVEAPDRRERSRHLV